MTWHSIARPDSKFEAYRLIQEHFFALIASEGGMQLDSIAKMSTLASLIYNLHPSISWVGFYRMKTEHSLLVGPYCGTPACLGIDIARGVCGQCARTRKTVIVPDVLKHPGHIACDASTRSEIVVPVFSISGSLVAVLDMDSKEVNAFDEEDAEQLEAIIHKVL
jgi:L-methionine (R)-S-oxide reductase